MSAKLLESLRRNAARKSELDADKELLTKAATEIERLSSNVAGLVVACENCIEDRGDWLPLMTAAVTTAKAAP